MLVALSLALLLPIGSAGLKPESAALKPRLHNTTASTIEGIGATGAFFALSVADIDASARWYSDKLGTKVTMREPNTNGAAVAVLEGDGLIVELIQHDAAKPLNTVAPNVKDPLYVHGIFKVGVIVSDFEKTLSALKTRNVEIAFGPYPARPGQRANVIVRDNARNLIQFFGTESK
jgi:catechol 2,3-dioxygenase-like lactoylglutathione lyase family enzyme